jgi:hypothetical protein
MFGDLYILGLVLILMIILAAALYSGRMPMLIAGYNTMSPKKRNEIDEIALSRYVGKMLFADAGAILLLILNLLLFKMETITLIGVVFLIAIPVTAIIYANTGNRFKK